MRKENGIQNIVIIALVVAVMVMSVGFAVFSQDLSISGTATAKASKWDVHFVGDTATSGKFTETSGTGYVTGTHTTTDTSLTFAATLTKPGDKYEFTIDVTNAGTFNANLTSITMSTLSTAQQKYLTYTLDYAGTDYTASASNLTTALNAGSSATVTVTVEYIQPTNASDLPSSDVNVELTATLGYQQAT